MKDNESITEHNLDVAYQNKGIALLNLETGETFDTKLKLSDDRFRQRGHIMYNNGIIGLLQKLTNTEAITLIGSFNADNRDYNNIYTKTFAKVFKDMDKSNRHRFKAKLVNNEIIFEVNGKYMLNPYIFIPRGDRNVKNSIYLTQNVWRVLVGDSNNYSDDIIKHMTMMFGNRARNKDMIMYVGKDKHQIVASANGRLEDVLM